MVEVAKEEALERADQLGVTYAHWSIARVSIYRVATKFRNAPLDGTRIWLPESTSVFCICTAFVTIGIACEITFNKNLQLLNLKSNKILKLDTADHPRRVIQSFVV